MAATSHLGNFIICLTLPGPGQKPALQSTGESHIVLKYLFSKHTNEEKCHIIEKILSLQSF